MIYLWVILMRQATCFISTLESKKLILETGSEPPYKQV